MVTHSFMLSMDTICVAATSRMGVVRVFGVTEGSSTNGTYICDDFLHMASYIPDDFLHMASYICNDFDCNNFLHMAT